MTCVGVLSGGVGHGGARCGAVWKFWFGGQLSGGVRYSGVVWCLVRIVMCGLLWHGQVRLDSVSKENS